jgi:predicted 2-oxoglutarate/Fe(II)-dependent dioxygenase YbiX
MSPGGPESRPESRPDPQVEPTIEPRAPKSALAPGDRMPNFVLADQEGAFRAFYERVRGHPTAVLLLLDADLQTEIEGVAAALATAPPAADIFVIAPADRAPLTPPADKTSLGRALLVDTKRTIINGLVKASGLSPRPGLWLLLDTNQRLIEAKEGAGLAGWALQRLAALSPPSAGPILDQAAPVLLVPRVLDQATCAGLIERWHRLGHEEGSVNSMVEGEEVQRVYHQMKKRRDHAIQDEALLKMLVGVIGRRIAPELDKAFGFNRFRFDRFIVTCYDAERGDYFRRHRDNASPSTADRRFALTLNLNSEEHEGGELIFPEYGPQRYRPGTGGAILFSCSLLHEALPVTRGQRFTLLSFLRSPEAASGGSGGGSGAGPAR